MGNLSAKAPDRLFEPGQLMAPETSPALVEILCLEAGRLMENMSVQLAHALHADLHDQAVHLLRMQEAAADISSPMDAAEELNRCANETD